MAKIKRVKIEKETRRLIESISHLVKKSSTGNHYKFKKGSKKAIRKIKRTCCHWIIRHGVEQPALRPDRKNKSYWKCGICGARFPQLPKSKEDYEKDFTRVIEDINQIEYWIVKLGGDMKDIDLITKLKINLPRMIRLTKHILKVTDKEERNYSIKRELNGIDDPFAPSNSGYGFR